MKFSQLFFRNNFFDKQNHNLELIDLMRKACFVHQDSSGIYSTLGLGLKLQQKLESVMRTEMESIGFSEVQLSILQDTKLWKQTQRLDSYGQELFRLKDRKGHELCLSATAEELITDIVKNHYQGSKINLNVFQIGNKYRDEIRARAGLVRAKQFVMKDGYSFYSEESDLIAMYAQIKSSYEKIFSFFDLKYEIISSDNGEIGGKSSEEFLIESEYGEEINGKKMLELGHIFQLGQEYSQKMGLVDNIKNNVYMGCYGIGVSRLFMALCENHKDKHGFWGDDSFSTFDLIISAIDYHRNDSVKILSDELYQKYKLKGVNVLLDDRSDNAGKKMTDAELIGVKKRLVISHQAMEKSQFEVLTRKTMEKSFISLGDLINI